MHISDVIHLQTHAHKRFNTPIHTCTYVLSYTYIHIHTYIHTYTCIHTYRAFQPDAHRYIHTYIHTYRQRELAMLQAHALITGSLVHVNAPRRNMGEQLFQSSHDDAEQTIDFKWGFSTPAKVCTGSC